MIRAVGQELIDVRPAADDDEPRVLELLNESFQGARSEPWSSAYFRWKHRLNPFGRSLMLVAEAEGRIIGLRAFMRWRFRTGERTLEAVRAVDTATHPDHQGRGVFSRLTLAALDALGGNVDFVFNTPNDKSRPGYLKMGWHLVGQLPVSIRVRRPIRFASGLRTLRDQGPTAVPPAVDAERAVDVLAEEDGLAGLLANERGPDHRLGTPRDAAFLRWRYGSAPGLDYRAIRHSEGDRLRGLAIFRVRQRGRLWEATVAEVIVEPGDHRAARRLFRDVVAAAPVDHLACHVPVGSTAAAAMRRSGFLKSPKGIAFTVNRLRDDFSPDPTDLRSWALSLGDVEVF